jgi:hypothetical protein
MAARTAPRLGLTVAIVPPWPEGNHHGLSARSSGLWPTGQDSAWWRHYPSESH